MSLRIAFVFRYGRKKIASFTYSRVEFYANFVVFFSSIDLENYNQSRGIPYYLCSKIFLLVAQKKIINLIFSFLTKVFEIKNFYMNVIELRYRSEKSNDSDSLVFIENSFVSKVNKLETQDVLENTVTVLYGFSEMSQQSFLYRSFVGNRFITVFPEEINQLGFEREIRKHFYDLSRKLYLFNQKFSKFNQRFIQKILLIQLQITDLFFRNFW